MKNQRVSRILRALFVIFIATVLQSNFTSATEKEQQGTKAKFTPLYPYTEDCRAINEAIAEKVGIDLTKQGSVKIAVIDSGADVAIDALQGKVDIYRDYTRENILKLKKARIGAGKVIFCDNKRYYLGELLQKNAVYHIGGLDLKKYPALNSDSVYGVLSIVRAGKKDGIYRYRFRRRFQR